MNLYRLLLRRDLNLVGSQQFAAEDTMSARFVAAAIFEACGRDCDSYELWENAYRIDTALPLSARMVTGWRQAQLITTEEAILKSKWAIARSEQLLAGLTALKSARA